MLDNLLDFSDITCTNESSQKSNLENAIAIIGMSGCISSLESYKEFWNALLNDKDCIVPYPKEREKEVALILNRKRRICNAGYMKSISTFDHAFFDMSYKEASFTDPNQRLFLQTVFHALENAGYAGESIRGSKTVMSFR